MWAKVPRLQVNESLSCWASSIPGGNSTVPSWTTDGIPIWATDKTDLCLTIYEVLIEQAKQYLLTVSLASIAGSACFVYFANRFPRKQWLTYSFFVLAVLFVITGGVYYGVNHTPASPATIVFVALCHFMFNFGMHKPPTSSSHSSTTLR
jgi:PHS family inorganic phosphate transporter-like MFS transporter